MIIKYIPRDKNDADIFTKNVTSAVFNCHMPLYVGHDEYVKGKCLTKLLVGRLFEVPFPSGFYVPTDISTIISYHIMYDII